MIHKNHLGENTSIRDILRLTPRSLQNNNCNLPDNASDLMHENMAQDGALRAQTGSRHFKVEVAISTYFIQTIPTLDQSMRKMALILLKIVKTGTRTVGCCKHIASVL